MSPTCIERRVFAIEIFLMISIFFITFVIFIVNYIAKIVKLFYLCNAFGDFFVKFFHFLFKILITNELNEVKKN